MSCAGDREPRHLPWYHEGLRFRCTRCGACCTGAPGYVWVDDDRIQRLAALLEMDPGEFTRRYVRRVGPRLSLVERPNGDCIFWDRDRGCTVYSERPGQCRTWPFWPGNLERLEAWEATKKVCPGSGQGELHDLAAIEDALARVKP